MKPLALAALFAGLLPAADLPYVYTKWKSFTVADGLPNDHVFAVKADGPRVWVGTENGLAMIDKHTGKIRSWTEKDGLPWRVVDAIDVDKKTGDVWLGMFGGGLARFSGGRFDHWTQLNSGLVNDVVYGVAVQDDYVWAATTAGASRLNTVTGEWTIFNEKNAPMEEIWNYGVSYAAGKVLLAVWGSGVLEYDVATGRWKDYLDPDGEMELDLYRDDGLVHVITTAASLAGNTMWVSTYFGASRYDGRHWRGYYNQDSGLPSDFVNFAKARSADEAWFCTDKGVGAITDFATNTWVVYTHGKAVVMRDRQVLETVDLPAGIPNDYVLGADLDGNDVWIATSKGLAWGRGEGYYPRLAQRPARTGTAAASQEAPALPLKQDTNYANTPQDVEPYRGIQPYKRYFLTQMEYTGPGRSIPEPPPDLKSVKIGFIGPITPTVSVATGGRSHEEALGTKMLEGARLAIEQANAAGGYLKRKIPFELVISNDNGLWGSSGNEIVKQAYKDHVWAILGTIDSANSHIAIRAAFKAEVPLMNTGDTDPTFIETNIPWVMRDIGDDRQMAYLLMDYLIGRKDYKRLGIIRGSNRYGRFGVREIRDSARRLQRPIVLEMAYRLGETDFSLQLQRLKEANVDAIIHWGDAKESALILNQMRKLGMKQPYYTSDRSVSEEFVKLAGANAEGVIAGYPWDPDRKDPKLEAFRQAFRRRYSEEPETYAAHAYDGMNLLLWAIQQAGLNRAKIRDALATRSSPWPGVTGDIPFSAVLDDLGEVFLAKREGGRWRYLSREDLNIPRNFLPQRDRVAPENPPVKIGYFGPENGAIWQGATLAIEEANREDGYRGRAFRLAQAWADNPWAGGVSRLARLAFDGDIQAVIAGIDGPTTHLAEQVATKALLPLINPAATDRSIHGANLRWMFSCVPGDNRLAALVAAALPPRFAVLSGTDHDSRAFLAELQKLRAPQLHVEFDSRDATQAAGRALSAGALLVVANAADSARVVRALRERGFSGALFGDARAAGIEGVRVPRLSSGTAEFQRRFAARWRHAPDYRAAHAYDAARLLVAAIRTAGLNRAAIRDALQRLSGYEGVTGTIRWDAAGQNEAGVALAAVR